MKVTISYFSVMQPKPMTLLYDSQLAILIAMNLVFHECTKHIKIDCHFVQEQVRASTIAMSHLSSEFQLMDISQRLLNAHSFNFYLASWASMVWMCQLKGSRESCNIFAIYLVVNYSG